MFKPKIVTTLKDYSAGLFVSDLTAGVIVGIVALPLAIAFGIASGVTPQKGLVTAIVAGFLISALGGSRVQIGGPTGAFVVIVYGIVQKYGVDGLVLATILAGIILIVMGLARMGTVIKFIPHPVVVGFTSGIVVIIFSSQVKDFLGLSVERIPAGFVDKWRLFFGHFSSWNLYAAGLALVTILLINVWPKVSRKIPGSLIAILFCSVAAHFLHWPVETIGGRFGDLPHGLTMLSLPKFDMTTVKSLIQPAFTIALLGGIESLLSAVVADGMIGSRHRSNTELIEQGIANIGSGLFGGIPATGAIARTATNIKNGGKTPVAGIVHALTLLAILLFVGPWARFIPMACLAGILVMVAYYMSEWRSFAGLLRGPRNDVLVLLATFFLTVFVDLTVAIEVGMVLSAFLFMHHMSTVTKFHVAESELEDERIDQKNAQKKIPLPTGVDIYEINGPFFFGVCQEFEETLRFVSQKPKVQILRLERVPFIDASGLYALERFHKTCQKRNVKLLLCGTQTQVLQAMKESVLYDQIGKEHFTQDIQEALRLASKDAQPSGGFNER